MRDEIDKLRTQSRDVTRQRSLETDLQESSLRLERVLVADQPSPSQSFERSEQERRLPEAIQRLPEAQRQALVLQRWHSWSLAQIAEHLGCSQPAVAGLLHRSLKALKKDLQKQE